MNFPLTGFRLLRWTATVTPMNPDHPFTPDPVRPEDEPVDPDAPLPAWATGASFRFPPLSTPDPLTVRPPYWPDTDDGQELFV